MFSSRNEKGEGKEKTFLFGKFSSILLCCVVLSLIRFIECQVVVIYFNHMFQTFVRMERPFGMLKKKRKKALSWLNQIENSDNDDNN